MTPRRRAAALAAAALVPWLAAGCGGRPAGEPAASDDVVQKRVVEFFQKTITTPPGLSFAVTRLEDGDAPGWRKGILGVTLGEQKQDITFHVTRDGRYLIRGEIVDLTLDPFLEVQKRIQLDGQPSRGPAGAKVTVVEYSDFQCPYCSRAYLTLENQVLKDYGDKVRFVFKNFPLTSLHPWAEPAAIASECAFQQGNDAFWAVYRGFFEKQADVSTDNVRAKAIEFAQAANADPDKLGACIDARGGKAAVEDDEAEATRLGITSTPTTFVNGRRIGGAQSADAYKKAIDEALSQAG